jgi:hypothetical protein
MQIIILGSKTGVTSFTESMVTSSKSSLGKLLSSPGHCKYVTNS